MIRKYKKEDLDKVMSIWLNANIQVHEFIPKEYWYDAFDKVKDILPKAEVYVYENEMVVKGFVGMEDNYIAGIFVSNDVQSKGIGKMLLRKCQGLHARLTLKVYKKNRRAVQFYLREGFIIDHEEKDYNTEEEEYVMVWRK